MADAGGHLCVGDRASPPWKNRGRAAQYLGSYSRGYQRGVSCCLPTEDYPPNLEETHISFGRSDVQNYFTSRRQSHN
eukprot:scaffold49025_cov36-Cyclotella_meneghiniana.AAC.2